jgi:hypothetical protein
MALKDDETRLVPYDKLSRGAKQTMDLSRRAALEKAKKDNEATPKADAVAAAIREVGFAPESMKAADRAAVAARNARREGNIANAQSDADYEDTKGRKLFGDTVPHKMDPNAPAFKKGGRVAGFKGYGKAKKV